MVKNLFSMFEIIQDNDGNYVIGPQMFARIEHEFQDHNRGRHMHKVRFDSKKIHLVPFHRPDDYFFDMEVSNSNGFHLAWKGTEGYSEGSQQDFRHCLNMLKAWMEGLNKVIDGHKPYQEEAERNRAIFKSENQERSSPQYDASLSKRKFFIPIPSVTFRKIRFSFWCFISLILALLTGHFLRLTHISYISLDERNMWIGITGVLFASVITLIVALNNSKKN